MKRKKLPADRAVGAQISMTRPNWRSSALALAAAVLLGASATDASALALGRITVQSALGEPLRADIDIVEINAEELATLKATVASPDTFRAAGLEYSPALTNVQITLQRRPDGRPFLQLSSQRAVNDPFIDLILETQWASGRVVRDYTMLFDPANLRQSPPPAVQVAPVTPPARVSPGTTEAAPAPKASRPTGVAAPSPAQVPGSPASAKGDGKQVKVASGDTAGRIALDNKPANVSLDQMLMALLHANPDAFIGGNVNRLKAGAVLEVPGAEQAGQEPAGEARQTVIAQSRDFNEYRRRLAEGLPTTRVAPADRQASGKVQAQVQEKKPATPSPDKLTLSKGAIQGKAAADKIARDREAQDAAARLAELNKNISDLNRLGTAAPAAAVAASAGKSPTSSAATAPAASSAVASLALPATAPAASNFAEPAASAAAAPASAVATPVVTGPATAASEPAAASTPASSPVVAPKSAAAANPIPGPSVETSLIDDLLDNTILLAALGGLLLLLLGVGGYRWHQRRKSTQVDSSFLESRLQPDSFFGASGGQRIDTNENGATGSSMVYSPSQLDAAGDVDPVAEADVYLAYGRDLQAEEILKEALRTTPQRVAIHSKLLEIYAKRRDAKAFEVIATEAYGLTRGEGPEWEHICGLGQELDSGNLLYRPGGQPAEGAAAAAPKASAGFGPSTAAQTHPSNDAPDSVDLDLDLDFSLGDEPEPPKATPAAAPHLSMGAERAPQPSNSLDMDFDAVESAAVPLARPAVSPNTAAKPAVAPAIAALPDLELPDAGLTFTTEPPPAPVLPAAAPAPSVSSDAGMIEFDLGALSLDLNDSAAPAAPATRKASAEDEAPSTAGPDLSTGGLDAGGDPLATKFALAQEFNAIGDPDGARSLAEEVLAEASGDLKHRAQRFLAEIG
jgi:pilus assembly protein FimV